ncbi:MAG: sulfotransferase [Lysobacterales bacterium]
MADLGAVIDEESHRRGQRYPEWLGVASAADWRRLGRRYLDRTAKWRREKPRMIDKMPNNWLYLGAALAMLPGARVVDCRRDAFETAWSCYKQLFSGGAVFAHASADIATWSARTGARSMPAPRALTHPPARNSRPWLRDLERGSPRAVRALRPRFRSGVLDFHAADRRHPHAQQRAGAPTARRHRRRPRLRPLSTRRGGRSRAREIRAARLS